jgi:hypothetical protein
MRRFVVGLLVLTAENIVAQPAPSFEHTGRPFVPANCEIVWNVPTNQMPNALWTYKTIPQHFSDKAISNLVALGSFTRRDRKKITAEDFAKLSSEERVAAKGLIGFVNKDETRSLGIFPATGYIHYRDDRAGPAQFEAVEDVPSEAEAYELALKLLDQLEIPRSELARKPNSSELLTFKEVGRWGRMYKDDRKRVEKIKSRGIFFIRQIDGVTFAGIGVGAGAYVNFVSHAKVEQLEVVWRNLQPYKKYEVASPGQIIQWIKDGKAAMPAPNVNPAEVKKLTITDISPQYMGALGETRQDFTYPFASLGTIAETGETNISVQLYCPILSEKEAKP